MGDKPCSLPQKMKWRIIFLNLNQEKNIDAEKEDEDGPEIIKEGEEGEGERDKSLAAESAMWHQITRELPHEFEIVSK